MQRSHTGLTCRAHDRFNPSIALWQHFVQANPSKPRDRRQLSTATPATQHDATAPGKHAEPESATSPEARDAQPSHVETREPEKEPTAKPWNLRMMKTDKGPWLSSKVAVSIAKNKKLRREALEALPKEHEKLLAAARHAHSKLQSYKGVIVKPMMSETSIKESQLPWCLNDKDRALPGISRLRLEITKFYNYTTPDHHETLARKHVVEQVRNHLRKSIPDYKVEVFGSERTGISMPLSDLDFRLVPKSESLDPAHARLPPSQRQRTKNIKMLQSLRHAEFRTNKEYTLPVVRHARYPLISVQDGQSGLDIQVVLANDTSVSRVIMQGYMDEIPYLRELYCVVKTIFNTRGLSDVFRGGFGTYPLFMMVVASIKHSPSPPGDSARALLNFLHFWGNFNTAKRGISIEPAYFYDKAEYPVLTDVQKAKWKNGKLDPLPDYMLSLRDPADETNDLGRKGVAIKHVQVTLRDLHYRLVNDTNMNTRPSLLAPLVGNSYLLQLERRRKLQEYGRDLEKKQAKMLSQKADAVRGADQLGQSMLPQPANGEVLKTNEEEEETKQRLAREQRDRDWQRLTDEMNERLSKKAEKALALAHGDAMATIPGMPAVEEESQAKETITT
ncbi:hypothetical protein GT037_008558 [Alternaria burnsii]|uniref:Poly(A) RNA polymerase mitochondrial-like central palm domain-containing protein n=1 Tax=Alternaria burnsii TaxID=1187904 RepID=A0A8H7AZ28_9PLEO|nr:uncharacterized protein GT037_008558 [Alternaria burnsii]KAF7673235.1 hypothetical protein GT037_008558 [Alternaria burnsii]CAI9637557.1 unnamed protein product [Alternaria burnsii]